MPYPKAKPIELTKAQREILERIARRQTGAQRVVRRATIILKSAAGLDESKVARAMNVDWKTVHSWRERWLAAAPRLVVAQGEAENERDLADMIEALLDDKPRPGVPPTFSAEQVTQILAVACEPPEESGRPVTHWTPAELADEAIKRGIVGTISPRQVGRFLKWGRPQTAPDPLLAQRRSARP